MSERINTVNVMVFKQGYFHRIFSYNDNTKGNKQAERKFASLIRKNWWDVGQKKTADNTDIKHCIDNGHFENGEGWECYLVHSN